MNKIVFQSGTATSQAPRIRSFARFPDGWHYGSGVAATEAAVAMALEVDSLFVQWGAQVIEAFPDIDGGALVSGYYGKQTLDVLCKASGEIAMTYEPDDDTVEDERRVSRDEVEQFLRGLEWKPESSFDCYITSSSASILDASRATPSRNHPGRWEGFRSLTCNALSNSVEVSAHMSEATTQVLLDHRSYFGGSILGFCPSPVLLHANPQIQAIFAIVTSEEHPKDSARNWLRLGPSKALRFATGETRAQ